jgi:sigma-B regulation protein RsbU (phosphoserine phosphatase)
MFTDEDALRMSSAAHLPELQLKLRNQLADRRARLESTVADVGQAEDVVRLLAEVDAALNRLDAGTYGTCTVCHLTIDQDDLLANPMATYCLCKLSAERQRALERDLDLAWHVQAALLPKQNLAVSGWQTHYRYLPHGPVSGDYCDLIAADGEAAPKLYFTLGDVSGKGVAASLLMAHMNASLRVFAESGLPPGDVIGKANRLLAESSLASHYATLVCGRASSGGDVEIANAGHCSPIVVRAAGSFDVLESSGLPLGLMTGAGAGVPYAAESVTLHKGDVLVVYTDGLTEAANSAGDEYGMDRLTGVLERCRGIAPRELIAKCLADLALFLDGEERTDDLTILALGRE